MNNSTCVFLINPNTRAVKVQYDPNDKTETPKVHKTFDAALKVDDLVIVATQTRHGFTVGKIVEVDVDFDMDTTAHIEWIVGPLDIAAFKKLQEQEATAVSTIKSAELREKRNKLANSLLANSLADLKTLDIAMIGGPAAEAPKPQAPLGGLTSAQAPERGPALGDDSH